MLDKSTFKTIEAENSELKVKISRLKELALATAITSNNEVACEFFRCQYGDKPSVQGAGLGCLSKLLFDSDFRDAIEQLMRSHIGDSFYLYNADCIRFREDQRSAWEKLGLIEYAHSDQFTTTLLDEDSCAENFLKNRVWVMAIPLALPATGGELYYAAALEDLYFQMSVEEREDICKKATVEGADTVGVVQSELKERYFSKNLETFTPRAYSGDNITIFDATTPHSICPNKFGKNIHPEFTRAYVFFRFCPKAC